MSELGTVAQTVISVFRRRRQEDLLLFETSLDYIVRSKTS